VGMGLDFRVLVERARKTSHAVTKLSVMFDERDVMWVTL